MSFDDSVFSFNGQAIALSQAANAFREMLLDDSDPAPSDSEVVVGELRLAMRAAQGAGMSRGAALAQIGKVVERGGAS